MKTHFADNIKNRRLSVLEQACERYAIMTYEVLTRQLAMDFRSTRYVFLKNPRKDRGGIFTATFVPREQTDKYRHGHRSTEVKFEICAEKDGKWTLSSGTATDLESGRVATIRFTHDGSMISLRIPDWHEHRTADNALHGPNVTTPLDKEPWGNLYNSYTLGTDSYKYRRSAAA